VERAATAIWSSLGGVFVGSARLNRIAAYVAAGNDVSS
jgi:hypothetical protein